MTVVLPINRFRTCGTETTFVVLVSEVSLLPEDGGRSRVVGVPELLKLYFPACHVVVLPGRVQILPVVIRTLQGRVCHDVR